MANSLIELTAAPFRVEQLPMTILDGVAVLSIPIANLAVGLVIPVMNAAH